MKASMYFLLNSLDIQRGGLTKASLAQANTFSNMGYETHILTFNFNTKYDNIRKQLVNSGLLNENIKVLNLYEELCEDEGFSKETTNSEEDEFLDPHIGHNGFRVYQNGLYTKYKRYHQDGKLDFIDYFNDQRYRTKREIYDDDGLIRKVSFMDFSLNKPRQMIFYNNQFNAYLSKWVNPETGKAIRVNWFGLNGKIKEIYSSDDQLKTAWIERVIENVENPVIVADARNTDQLMINVKNKKCAKIWRLHSNHLTAPFEIDSEIAPTVKTGLNNLEKIDAALLLTEQQKNDIEKRFGKSDKYHVISHAMEPKLKVGFFSKPDINKNKNLAVVISRYSAIKNLDHIIIAFKTVQQKLPEARLEFWGQGSEKNKLQELINNYNLQQHIKLNDYTNNPHKVYQEGLFSILTSKTEGFSLSILESMANATPVISYDIRYGPHALIDHGENGVLVEKNNIDLLADSMISMFSNPDKAIKMGRAALKKVETKFNQTNYEKAWEDIVTKALNNRQL